MSGVGPRRVALCAHPQAGAAIVQSITVEALITRGGALGCRYELRADTARLRIPRTGAGRRVAELWRHTCFEAFIAVPDTSAYYEFNFSPALDWAAYRFEAYREGRAPPPLAQAPDISVHRGADRLELTASVPLDSLALPASALRVALAAVIEDAQGRLAYWALRHPPGKPDFHHPQSFTLELART